MTFNEEQMDFLIEEFARSRHSIENASDDELLEMADELFDIELEEDLLDTKVRSRRARLAGEIVTLINQEFGI